MIDLATERQNAKSVRARDISSARFYQGDRETMRPNFVVTGFGESVARAKVVGTIVEKFLSEDGRFASITIDDGTDAIRARVFSTDSRLIEDVDVGNLVVVVGKMKNYNDENYIAPDFVRRLEDPNQELLFRLEVLDNLFEKKKVADDVRSMRDQMSEDELREYAAEKYGLESDALQAILQSEVTKIDHKPLILDVIKKLDQGEGVEIGKILESSRLDESMAEGAINDLLSSGEIYEPTAGRLKRVLA